MKPQIIAAYLPQSNMMFLIQSKQRFWLAISCEVRGDIAVHVIVRSSDISGVIRSSWRPPLQFQLSKTINDFALGLLSREFASGLWIDLSLSTFSVI